MLLSRRLADFIPPHLLPDRVPADRELTSWHRAYLARTTSPNDLAVALRNQHLQQADVDAILRNDHISPELLDEAFTYKADLLLGMKLADRPAARSRSRREQLCDYIPPALIPDRIPRNRALTSWQRSHLRHTRNENDMQLALCNAQANGADLEALTDNLALPTDVLDELVAHPQCSEQALLKAIEHPNVDESTHQAIVATNRMNRAIALALYNGPFLSHETAVRIAARDRKKIGEAFWYITIAAYYTRHGQFHRPDKAQSVS